MRRSSSTAVPDTSAALLTAHRWHSQSVSAAAVVLCCCGAVQYVESCSALLPSHRSTNGLSMYDRLACNADPPTVTFIHAVSICQSVSRLAESTNAVDVATTFPFHTSCRTVTVSVSTPPRAARHAGASGCSAGDAGADVRRLDRPDRLVDEREAGRRQSLLGYAHACTHTGDPSHVPCSPTLLTL